LSKKYIITHCLYNYNISINCKHLIYFNEIIEFQGWNVLWLISLVFTAVHLKKKKTCTYIIFLFLLAYRLYFPLVFAVHFRQFTFIILVNNEYNMCINDETCHAIMMVRNAMCFRYCIEIKLCIKTSQTDIRIYGFSLIRVYSSEHNILINISILLILKICA